jgi:hypothetical protein
VPLVVQDNFFLVLPRLHQPNLASRELGLAVAAPPALWQQQRGVTPLLAEICVDPER